MENKLCLSLLLFLIIPCTHAEELFDIVRVSCVNDTNYLNISHERITLFSTAIDFHEPKNLSAWEKSGFYDPHNLKVKCHLSKSEYEITTSQSEKQDHGMCSQLQEIELSVLRNGIPIIKKTIFGESCYGNPSISKISFLEKKSDKDPDMLEVCYEKEIANGKSYVCSSYLDSYTTTKSQLPITQKSVEEKFK